ncbi:TPA: hypothetical protein ACPSKY_003649 [Legionella bozemanae]
MPNKDKISSAFCCMSGKKEVAELLLSRGAKREQVSINAGQEIQYGPVRQSWAILTQLCLHLKKPWRCAAARFIGNSSYSPTYEYKNCSYQSNYSSDGAGNCNSRRQSTKSY